MTQYFVERSDGMRMPITKEQGEIALVSKRFFALMHTKSIVVIRAGVKGVKPKGQPKPEPKLHFGGRGRGFKCPSGYGGF